MVNLAVKIGKLRLKNPVMAASGTFGPEYGELVDVRRIGAVVAKTITLKARLGNPPPRVVETASGMLNSIGLENKGLEDFIGNKLPLLIKAGSPVIVSIAGDSEDEFSKLARELSKTGKVGAIELNLSCPNVIRVQGTRLRQGYGGQAGYRVQGKRIGADNGMIAQDEDSTRKIVKAVRKATDLTIIAKLSPNVTDIAKIAKAAESAGADAVSLVNTFLGMALDIDTKRPILGNVTGGLSGPAIKPIALRMVWECYRKVKIPIIGIGGIMDHKDALEFILSGATAIQVGTANFVNPKAPVEIISGITKYLTRHKIADVNRLIGKLII